MCSAKGDQFKQRATELQHYRRLKILSLQSDLAVLETQVELLCASDALNTWHILTATSEVSLKD